MISNALRSGKTIQNNCEKIEGKKLNSIGSFKSSNAGIKKFIDHNPLIGVQMVVRLSSK